jgi:transcriptional regulator with GAF, ATPase, and Fis domain
MNPKLIITTGPLRGTIFDLSEEEITVGRDPSNQICLPDLSVSRHHCIIKKEAGQFYIIDLHSFNGTLVNSIQVDQQPLTHGAQIAVGDILLLFLEDGNAEPAMSLVQLDENDIVTGSTIRLFREEALYLNPEEISAALAPTARIACNLNTLLKISTIINSTRSSMKLQEQLLRLIFEVIPTERGAILLVGKNGRDIVSLIGYDKTEAQKQPVKVSKTITDQVIREGAAIIANDVRENEAFNTAQSLISFQTRSLLCVPLEILGSVRGVIYLDTINPNVKFDEDHLQLMMAIANIAAVAIENASHVERLQSENRQLQTEIHLKHNMIGDSPVMHRTYQLITQVAPTDATVLILGESGTGKELVAQAIHLNSSRSSKPFAAINCSAFPETLIESEFFGYEKGAFNEAKAQKKGLLETANGGTVFLDEVGELASTVQAKLLRALEECEFRRVGGTSTLKVDLRFVAATNRNLKDAILQKTFREDLYHRLNVFPLEIPPLRERGEDILLLANHFIFKYNKRYKRSVVGITPEAYSRLLNYSWPGNVRELKNIIERAVIMSKTDTLTQEDFLEMSLTNSGDILTTDKLKNAVDVARKQAIINAFKKSGGKHAEAAKILEVHPIHLHKLIRTLGLKPYLAGRGD